MIKPTLNRYCLFFCCTLMVQAMFFARLNAQTVIGGDTIDQSAVLDIQDTARGVLLPRLTTVQRNAIDKQSFGLLIPNPFPRYREIIKIVQVAEIHQSYLSKLVRIYLLDGHLSQSEISDLENVATLLNLENKLEWIIGLEKSMLPQMQKIEAHDCTGKSVCFTGELCSNINGRPVTREMAHEIALAKGMVIKSGVSAKLNFLVIADPHSQSNKARRARELNIHLLSEPMFWHLVGLRVD